MISAGATSAGLAILMAMAADPTPLGATRLDALERRIDQALDAFLPASARTMAAIAPDGVAPGRRGDAADRGRRQASASGVLLLGIPGSGGRRRRADRTCRGGPRAAPHDGADPRRPDGSEPGAPGAPSSAVQLAEHARRRGRPIRSGRALAGGPRRRPRRGPRRPAPAGVGVRDRPVGRRARAIPADADGHGARPVPRCRGRRPGPAPHGHAARAGPTPWRGRCCRCRVRRGGCDLSRRAAPRTARHSVWPSSCSTTSATARRRPSPAGSQSDRGRRARSRRSRARSRMRSGRSPPWPTWWRRDDGGPRVPPRARSATCSAATSRRWTRRRTARRAAVVRVAGGRAVRLDPTRRRHLGERRSGPAGLGGRRPRTDWMELDGRPRGRRGRAVAAEHPDSAA